MGAKKSHKGRKFGRNKRKSDRQKHRTEYNKVSRLNYERAKAGLPPVAPGVARALMDQCRISN